MDLGVRDKVAAIAGGSKGLGFGIARELAREGATCVIGGRNPETLKSACSLLEEIASPDKILGLSLDTSDAETIDAWLDDIRERFFKLDMLVVNTGGPPAGQFEDILDSQWDQAYRQNLLGVVRVVRAALPLLKSGKNSSILFITSTSTRQPIDNMILSNVFRPAVSALAKSLSLELAPSQIRVNTLMPGRIDTDRVKSLDTQNAGKKGISLDEQRRAMEGAIPLGRYGTAEEFGKLAAFLLSPAASYISGATIAVDGGMLRSI